MGPQDVSTLVLVVFDFIKRTLCTCPLTYLFHVHLRLLWFIHSLIPCFIHVVTTCFIHAVTTCFIHVVTTPQFVHPLFCKCAFGLIAGSAVWTMLLSSSFTRLVLYMSKSVVCQLGVRLPGGLAWWYNAFNSPSCWKCVRDHTCPHNFINTWDIQLFKFLLILSLSMSKIHTFLYVELPLEAEFLKLSLFSLLLVASQCKRWHQISNQFSDQESSSDGMVSWNTGLRQCVDGQPPTAQHFNSCAFPSWPLQRLRRDLIIVLIFGKGSGQM